MFFTCFVDLAQSQKLDEIDSFPANEFDVSGPQAVATVGDIKISTKEFLLSYEFGPAFLKRSKESKNQYLKVMIYEKLLALSGYKKGLHLEDHVIRSTKAYEEDIMTEELFKKEVMSEVSVSEQEIEHGLQLEQLHLSLKWLYAEDKNKIIMQWNALTQGVTFDSLFFLQFNDSIVIDDRSLKSTFFRLQKKNPSLAAIVDTLVAGNYSIPIKAPDGWYIVKLDNIQTNPILTETELNKIKHELQRSIFKQKLDILSDQYIQNMMNVHQPEIDKDTFVKVVHYINQVALHPNLFYKDTINNILKRNPVDFDAENYTVYKNEILVRGKSCEIIFGEFIAWYKPRMAYLKFNSSSAQEFILNVQQVLWRMVRDYLLVQKAKALGIDEWETVVTQKKWWQDKIVYNAVKADIASSINFEEDDLRKFYKKNMDNFLDKNGEVMPYDKCRNNIESDYIKEKYMFKLVHDVLKLKKEYSIQINEGLLQHLKVQDEADPDAIDFYAVKKGGLLPRQPYPTIDWEWQIWY
jgi:hypothetical protein